MQALNISDVSMQAFVPGQALPAASNDCVVILTSGQEDAGKRATLAFSLACTAQSMDRASYVFMIGDGVHWAYEGHGDGVQVAGFPALNELIETFVELGGVIFVCSTCDKVCGLPSGGSGAFLKRNPNIQPLGLASLLPYLDGASPITF